MVHFRPAWLETAACSRQTRPVQEVSLLCPPPRSLLSTCLCPCPRLGSHPSSVADLGARSWPPPVSGLLLYVIHITRKLLLNPQVQLSVFTHTHAQMGQTQPLCPAWSNVSNINQRTLCCAATSLFEMQQEDAEMLTLMLGWMDSLMSLRCPPTPLLTFFLFLHGNNQPVILEPWSFGRN